MKGGRLPRHAATNSAHARDGAGAGLRAASELTAERGGDGRAVIEHLDPLERPLSGHRSREWVWFILVPGRPGRGRTSRASADFKTVKWIYLRKTGETATYH